MTATLHFSSSSDRDTHFALVVADNGARLVRVLFHRDKIKRFERLHTNKDTYDVTAKAVVFARGLARAASIPQQCRNCTSFVPTGAGVTGLCRKFNRYTPPGATNCADFQSSSPDATPRRLFPGESPEPGDFYPWSGVVNGAPVRWVGAAKAPDLCGHLDRWHTYRPAPSNWKRIPLKELKEGDTILHVRGAVSRVRGDLDRDAVALISLLNPSDQERVYAYRKEQPQPAEPPLLLQDAHT